MCCSLTVWKMDDVYCRRAAAAGGAYKSPEGDSKPIAASKVEQRLQAGASVTSVYIMWKYRRLGVADVDVFLVLMSSCCTVARFTRDSLKFRDEEAGSLCVKRANASSGTSANWASSMHLLLQVSLLTRPSLNCAHRHQAAQTGPGVRGQKT